MWRALPLLLVASCSFQLSPELDDAQVIGDDAPGGSLDDACGSDCGIQTSCKDVYAVMPAAPSGIYTIDTDGDGAIAAFDVACDMATFNGGWTLVGRELVGAAYNAAGPLRLLGIDSMNAPMLAAGTEGGIIGLRFAGAYSEVMITWGTDYIRFDAPAGFEMFGNILNLSVPITNLATSDQSLAGWVSQDDGAVLCIASRSNDVSPGNSSWAIKPQSDNLTGCGCNSTGWAGRGAYYGGASAGNQTVCSGWGGGWAGVKDNGAPKAGLAPTVEARIWIR